MFSRGFIVLFWLCQNPKGLTVGQLAKHCKEFTKEQVRRTVNELFAQRYIAEDWQPHGRTGKRVLYATSATIQTLHVMCEKTLKQEIAN